MNVQIPADADHTGPAADLARRLAILDALATALAEPHDLAGLLDRALDMVLQITGVDGGGIFLRDERGGDLRLAVHRGVSDRLAASYAASPGAPLREAAANPHAAVIVRDFAGVQAPRPEMIEEGVRGYALIPISVHGQGLGALAVVSRTRSDFGAAGVELLVSIGRHIGLAIERARLVARERRRAGQWETLAEINRRLGAILDEQELLAAIVALVRAELGYEAVNLMMRDDSGRELVLAAAAGLGNEPLIGSRVPADDDGSMSGWTVQHNRPLLANDVSREPRHFHGGGMEQAELTIPICAGSHVLGVLDVQASRTGAFHESDIAVLQVLAGQIAVAIQNARLYAATERSLRRARAFQEVATAITASLDLQTILERALEAAMGVFRADRAGLYLIYPGTRKMYCAASRGLSRAYLDAVQEYFDTHDWPEALDTERSIYVADARVAHFTPELRDAVRREGFRSMLYLPLPDGAGRLGTFVLYHDRERAYSEEEITLACAYADQANIAIRHAYLFEAERVARERAAAILDATRAVTSSLRLDEVLTQAGACIAAALRQRTCAVWLLDEDETVMRPVYRIDTRANPAQDEIFRSLPPILVAAVPRIQALLRGERAYRIQRPDDLTEPERAVRRLMPFHAYVAVALAARERVVGIAAVPIMKPDYWVEKGDVEVAIAIARSVALAVENARLYEHSRQLAVSEERNRLARELHDSVTHSLFSMTLIAQALPRILDRDQDRARERIDRLNDLGRGALAEMRALIFQLRPAALEEHGLVEALTRHTAAFESRESVKVELTVTGARRLPLTIEEAVFRVAQEALNNVAKHARATRVTVALAVTDEAVELRIADDGAGFDLTAPQPPDRRGLGMTSMRERAALLGGACTIASAPSRGSTVHLRIPLAASPPPE